MRDALHQIRRLASNLDRYREITAEAMANPRGGFDARTISAVFACECARASCRETMTMTLAEYEVVRANPHGFFVAPSKDHVFSGFERIIEANSRYFVAERIADDPVSNGAPGLGAG